MGLAPVSLESQSQDPNLRSVRSTCTKFSTAVHEGTCSMAVLNEVLPGTLKYMFSIGDLKSE